MDFFDFSFWKDFVSNAFSTFLGALVGIPIALGISGYQNKQQESERKHKILRILMQELMMNFGQLTRWDKSKNPLSITSELCVFLKTEYWKAFSDGGELQWIKDPVLLTDIAEAYNFIRMMKELSERYLDLQQSSHHTAAKEPLAHIWKLLVKGIELTKLEISKATESIEKARKLT